MRAQSIIRFPPALTCHLPLKVITCPPQELALLAALGDAIIYLGLWFKGTELYKRRGFSFVLYSLISLCLERAVTYKDWAIGFTLLSSGMAFGEKQTDSSQEERGMLQRIFIIFRETQSQRKTDNPYVQNILPPCHILACCVEKIIVQKAGCVASEYFFTNRPKLNRPDSYLGSKFLISFLKHAWEICSQCWWRKATCQHKIR